MALIGWIFTLIGAIFFIVGACVMIAGIGNSGKGVDVPAVITSIERYTSTSRTSSHKRRTSTNYDVYVDYEYDGEYYTDIELNYYTSSMYEGKEITISIDPDKPWEPINTKFNLLFGGIFGGIGGIFLIIGLALLVKLSKKKALAKRLVQEGCYVEAQIVGSEMSAVRINNRPTYVIRCNYVDPADGNIYSFKSEVLRYDPMLYCEEGDSLRVYVDRNDFTKNYVDISELKNKYIEC